MDTNELRSLQEAYLEVVEGQQLGEIFGMGKKKAPTASQIANTPYMRKKKKEADDAAVANLKGLFSKDPEEKKKAAYRMSRSPDADKEYPQRKDTYSPRKEEVSVYDIVLSHLVDEGYADTVESAEGIMVNMSEDWRDSIVEELTGERRKRAQEKIRELRPKGRRRKSTDAAVGAIDRVVRSKEGGKDPSKFPTKRGGYGEKGKMKSYSMGGGSDRGEGNKAARRAGKSVQDTRGDED